MKVAVVIPWREQPSRIQSFNIVVDWYKTNLPEATIYYPNRPGPVWSMSGSRNDGVKMAEAEGADVIVVNDADTIPEIKSLKVAIDEAYKDNLMHLPYDRYYTLTPEGNRRYLLQNGNINLGTIPKKLVKGACSGVNVFTPKLWWSLGGNDEKFKQWGWEDTAMKRVHEVVHGTNYVSHSGTVISFSHKEQPKTGNENFVNNQRLFVKYLEITTPRKILELVASENIEDANRDNEYCLFILGNGRKGYLERTIASWDANLKDTPKYRIIFDDSGNPSYVNWLNKKFGDKYAIISIPNSPTGQVKAINYIFDYISKLDVDYVLEIEEDWMLFRPIRIKEIMEVMDSNPNILQMRIPRTIWYADYHVLDINAGSLLKHHLSLPGTKSWKNTNDHFSWYEWRGSFYFWSHNPCVFKKIICEKEQYNSSSDHELDFGKSLLNKYPNGTVGWWATNEYEGYVTHIGIRDNNLLNNMPSL